MGHPAHKTPGSVPRPKQARRGACCGCSLVVQTERLEQGSVDARKSRIAAVHGCCCRGVSDQQIAIRRDPGRLRNRVVASASIARLTLSLRTTSASTRAPVGDARFAPEATSPAGSLRDASQAVISAVGREPVATRCNPLEADAVACTHREARVDRASRHRNPEVFLYAAMHLSNAHRPPCAFKDADDCPLDDPVAQSTLDHAGRFARSPSDADRAALSGSKGS